MYHFMSLGTGLVQALLAFPILSNAAAMPAQDSTSIFIVSICSDIETNRRQMLHLRKKALSQLLSWSAVQLALFMPTGIVTGTKGAHGVIE